MIATRVRLPSTAWVLIAVATIVAIAWSLAVPVFEAPDEPHHWQVARYIHDHWALPQYGASMVEANQPPLYYVLIAPLARSSAQPSQAVWTDGEDQLAVPFPPRFYLNERDALFRYRALRLARILSAVLSVLGAAFVYLLGVEATGSSTLGLLAAGLAAFLPQFSFRAGSISNDTLLVTCSAATTWLIIRLLRRGFSWRRGVAIGAAFAAAYLTKISAIGLLPALIIAILFTRHPWRLRVWGLAGVLVVIAASVLPWSARNLVLYGDVFASASMRTAVASLVDVKPLTDRYFWTTFPYLLTHSFVGVFGWFNVWLPPWTYTACFVLAGLTMGGLVVGLVRLQVDRRVVAVLLAMLLGNLAVVVHVNLTFTQPQGRYMFPSLPALATLVAMGITALPHTVRRLAAAGLVAAMFTLNAYALCGVILPAYYPPMIVTPSGATLEVPPPRLELGLEPNGDGMHRITTPDPQVVVRSLICADDINFVQFELEGIAVDRVVLGSVYFARSDSPATEQQRVDFRWKADGRRRLITVPLAGQREWHGIITSVRIDPINGRVEANHDARLRLGRIWLKGSL